jgi:hypothetical protein
MPKLPMKYANTIIYKLCCNDVNVKEEYVGHTTNFTKRKAQHKICCCNDTNKQNKYYVYQFIRENGGWDNWSMVEIEKYNCANKNEAEKRERYWIETLKAKLNKHIPTRTNKEFREDNKEKVKEYQKLYREENKEKIKEVVKQYYEDNKTKISEKRAKNSLLSVEVNTYTLIKFVIQKQKYIKTT